MSDDVLTEVDEHGVMLVTLNRPETMNALGGTLGQDLLEALQRPARDTSVRAIVLTGAGRAFCAGAQISAASDPASGSAGGSGMRRRSDPLGLSGRTALAFRDCVVPVIGAINGPAAGGGFGIALGCDLRFAAESARLGSVFIKRGLSSDYGAAYWLPRIVGSSRAFEIMYEGEMIDARRALDLGLVNRVVPDERLLAETVAFARKVADGPPLAYAELRPLLHASLDRDAPGFLEREWASQMALLRTRDALEGFASFRERRAPKFAGQ